ncbi:MsnO8 family LLM class oxidoreductase [Kocuria atrinae]|uniref:MsnO8 family LLM class oxidoreductase n=1 Tax=Kocuria atrinae TaxID=592377 RepID=A0ABN2XIT1_9MICC
MGIPLSLLDRSRTRQGQPDAAALHQTVERARRAEATGYERFWVSEHHGVPGVASGTPALLAQAVAAATSTIRVGSGGVMLPNHRPIVVAEEFAVLTALHGGRFDLGLGRSLGFTKPVREALGALKSLPRDFAADIQSVRDYLDGAADITIRPADTGEIPLFVLGTGSGLKIAAQLGLPAVVGGPLLAAGPEPFDEYRAEFRPSAQQAEPYLVASVEMYVADSASEAHDLALPEAWAMSQSRLTGAFPPLAPTTSLPTELTQRQESYVGQALSSTIAGTEDRVLSEVSEMLARTGADEIMSTASTFDESAMYATDEKLARAIASL